MRKILTLLTVMGFISLSLVGHAQTRKPGIKGKAVDASGLPVAAATVSLYKAADSSLAKLTITTTEGRYEFLEISAGTYFLTITGVSFEKTSTPVFSWNAGADLELSPLTLQTQSKELKAFAVVGRKQLVEQKLDRMVVNVDAAVTNVGATALEVLEKSPGISVDKDGNISLKGKAGVLVYVDGRPSYLSGNDLANLLRNMSASQLDQIEIMTNPPAKYDAAGNSGIINIKTKKTKKMGYSGSLSLGYSQGYFPKLSESFNFNYRKGKVNLFTNIGYSYYKNYNTLTIQRKFIDMSTKELVSNFDQESRMKNENESFNGKLGMDFYASKKTTLGIVLGGFSSPGTFKNNSDVFIADAQNQPQSITRASTSNDRTWKNFTTNINFRHLLDTSGTELSADVDYLGYRSRNNQVLVNSYYDASGMPATPADSLLGNLPQNINIYSFKADYVHPMKKGARLEAGFKTSFVNTDNNALYDSILNGNAVPDVGRSNHFEYKENVNAAYVNYSRPLSEKFSAQLGLRVENTQARGKQLTTGEKFSRSYTQLFPTAYVQYDANKKNSFILNYGRRIQRPDYESMNPFYMFLDKYTYERGNPNLQPQFSHNIELSHTYSGFLTTTLNYSKTTDIITEVLEQDPNTNETVITPRNISKQSQYGISVSAGIPLTPWWTTNLWANVFRNKYTGIVNNDQIELGTTTGQFNVSNQIKLSDKMSAELGGFYRTPGVDGIFEIRGFGMVNAGISHQVLKGKGSVRLSVRDLFYTQKIKGAAKFSNIDASFQQVRDSRVFSINFNYRFSKGQAGSVRKRASGASDEESRVKSGN